MIKKSLTFLFCMIFLSSVVMAQILEISVISDEKIFDPGEVMKVKVSLYNESNNLIIDDVSIIIEDVKEDLVEERIITSNSIEEIELPEGVLEGEAKIIAKYGDVEATETFIVSGKKLVDVRIEGENLIITNKGNTVYYETIYIQIGDTVGAKNPKIKVGESVSYRLVAPEGEYVIRVLDEDRKSLFTSNEEVRLTGTGKVIGALDESGSVSGITGISPDEDSEGELLGMIKNSTYVYVFVLVIFGAMVLLAIEKRYRKKV
ncbi:MAG: hypothetical protein ABIB79_02185 [archaeon]